MTFLFPILALLYASTIPHVSALNSSQPQTGQLSSILYSGLELSSFDSQRQALPRLSGRDDRRSKLWSGEWFVFER